MLPRLIIVAMAGIAGATGCSEIECDESELKVADTCLPRRTAPDGSAELVGDAGGNRLDPRAARDVLDSSRPSPQRDSGSGDAARASGSDSSKTPRGDDLGKPDGGPAQPSARVPSNQQAPEAGPRSPDRQDATVEDPAAITCPSGYTSDGSGACIDIDECSNGMADCGSKRCVNGDGAYSCEPRATQVVLGHHHGCALFDDGTVRCWGPNGHGSLGNGALERSDDIPVQVSGMKSAVQLAAGEDFSCALLSDGTVACWGKNDLRQLGDGTTTDRNVPTLVRGVARASQVVAGKAHACAKLADRTAVCWGDNAVGQRGNGTGTTDPDPTPVVGLENIVELSAGSIHTCAMRSPAEVFCWGHNQAGEVGTGDNQQRLEPFLVPDLTNVSQVAAGEHSTCVRRSSGYVLCWGSNSSGQIGDGSTVDRLTPAQAKGVNDSAELATGGSVTCSRSQIGAVRCWGSNMYSQIASGGMPINVAAEVNDLQGAVQLSVNSTSICTLADPGTVACRAGGRLKILVR